ncbi:60 kDa chaperonin [archaeon HR01]|nr:60 kDa chaperonin [archaeon HR01]
MGLGFTEYRERDALRENCTAAKLVADMVSTSYGPAGMYKILLRDDGDFNVTKNVEMLSKDVASVHPVVRLLVETGKSVKSSTGDGFISTIILAGQLIGRAWKLIQEGIHPEVISRGYHIASRMASQTISRYSIAISHRDRHVLDAVVKTLLNTKLSHSLSDKLAPMLVEALLGTAQNFGDGVRVDGELVVIEGRRGGSLSDTELIDGVVLHKRGVDRLMPRRIENARIALVYGGFSIERPDMFTKVVLSKTFGISDFYRARQEFFDDVVEPILKLGVNVVICGENIDEMLRRLLARHNVLFVRNVSKENMKVIANAVGAVQVLNPRELSEEKLGRCKLVEERILAALDRWIFFEGCPNERVKSILVRGPTDKVVEEVKRVLRDCLKTVEVLLNSKAAAVPGGGAIEIRTAETLRNWAYSLGGKEQYAVLAFAEALEQLPAQLAKNVGVDHLDVLAELRRMNLDGFFGLDGLRGVIVNPFDSGILDPAFVKKECIAAATEVASLVIRVDHTFIFPFKSVKKSPIPEPVKAVRRTSQILKNIRMRRT